MADQEMKGMAALILGVVVIAVTLVIGIYIQASLETTVDADGTVGISINESLVKPNMTTLTLPTGFYARNGVCGTITTVLNTTNNVVITAGNYTQVGCVVTNKTNDLTLGQTWFFTYPYTYSAGSAASNAAGSSVSALSNGTPWLTIIVVVSFAVIVLGMLTAGFNRGSTPNQAVY